jgi:hypothetical protein
MRSLAIFVDFGPLGPIIALGVLAALATLVFLAGVAVGAVMIFLFLRRRKATSRRSEEAVIEA